MTQARRIKRKPAKKKSRKSWNLSGIPWMLMSVVLISGIVIGLLISGSQRDGSGFGSGLKELFSQSKPQQTEDKEIAELIEEKSSEKEFEFYELLPEIEKVMPKDTAQASPTRSKDPVDYFMQAASFREFTDAEKLRAKLALKGFKSVTQAREVKGKGTYYRVRLGPYADKRKAKTAKNKLQKLGVRPFIYTVKK